MIDIISDNYSMLQGLSAFGIRLGFGDKTVSEVCSSQDVDCHTFLTVVNFLINGYVPKGTDERISVKTLLTYLQASHRYFLDFQLPSIRRKLEESLSKGDDLAILILRLYDEYARDVHMPMSKRSLPTSRNSMFSVSQMSHGEKTKARPTLTWKSFQNIMAAPRQSFRNLSTSSSSTFRRMG